MKIKGAVLREANKPLTIETLELEPPGEGEVLVKYVNTAFCHSDLHFLLGEMGELVPYPFVVGHETAGVVEEVGPKVTKVEKGDHVTATWMIPCGKCPQCQRGRGTICTGNLWTLSSGQLPSGAVKMADKNGELVFYQTFVSGFATHMVIPEDGAIVLPKELPFDQGCFMGCCVPTGWGSITKKAEIQPGDSVVVFGMGGVGLNAVRAAALSNANPVIAVDIEGSKEAIAREFGATDFIDSSKEDPVERIRTETGGLPVEGLGFLGGGVDIVVEAIGDPGAYIQAYWCLAAGGKLVAPGIIPAGQEAPMELTFLPLQEHSILGTLYGSISTDIDIPRYAHMAMTQDLKLDKLITKHFKLEEINDVAEAMKRREIIGRWVCDLD